MTWRHEPGKGLQSSYNLGQLPWSLSVGDGDVAFFTSVSFQGSFSATAPSKGHRATFPRVRWTAGAEGKGPEAFAEGGAIIDLVRVRNTCFLTPLCSAGPSRDRPKLVSSLTVVYCLSGARAAEWMWLPAWLVELVLDG